MRQKHPHVDLGELCALFGVSRQAYYEVLHHAEKTSIAHTIVLWVFRSDGASDFGLLVPLKRSCNYIKKLWLFLFQYSFSQGFTFEVNPV